MNVAGRASSSYGPASQPTTPLVGTINPTGKSARHAKDQATQRRQTMSNSDPYLNLTGLEDMLAVEVRQRNRDRRERIATAASQGMLSNPEVVGSPHEIAACAARYADILIALLDKEDGR